MENTLLEKLINAVDEVILYRTDGKIQMLKKVREEIRKHNELVSQLNAFKPDNISQADYRKLFPTLVPENISQADYRKLFPTLVPGEHNDC